MSGRYGSPFGGVGGLPPAVPGPGLMITWGCSVPTEGTPDGVTGPFEPEAQLGIVIMWQPVMMPLLLATCGGRGILVPLAADLLDA